MAQRLEERRMLAVLSPPSELLPTGPRPIAVDVGTFNHDTAPDAVVLSESGDLTLAYRSEGDYWRSVETVATGFGPQHSLVAERLNADMYSDLVLMSSDEIRVLHRAAPDGDSAAEFDLVQTFVSPSPGAFGAGGPNSLLVDFVDADAFRDFVAVVPGENSVRVYPGLAGGTFASPLRYPTGVAGPSAVAVGNFFGDPLPDLVVGHTDGSIVYFEGQSSPPEFRRRDDLGVTAQGEIKDLIGSDIDGDGNTDLVVTSTHEVLVLYGKEDPEPNASIVNGQFFEGLTGWETEIVGHRPGTRSGRIETLGGAAQFFENDSFLTSLQQTFPIPTAAQSLSFDLVDLGLDSAGLGIPDAFEVSLLDVEQNSLVATHSNESTAFFNLSAGMQPSIATGVTYTGGVVTVDVSSVERGASATIVFDLIGNPPETDSTVTIDDVRLTPDRVLAQDLDLLSIANDLTDAVDSAVGDVDGDGFLDIVVADNGNRSVVIFHGGGERRFQTDSISVSPFGSNVSSIESSPLTAGDPVDDLMITLVDTGMALSPIRIDTDNGKIEIDPLTPLSASEGQSLSVTAGFSDPDRVGGYNASVDWGDGTVSAAVITVDVTGNVGTIQATHIYADEGQYLAEVTITDLTGGSASQTTDALIAGVAPDVVGTPGLTADVDESTGFELASISDPGFTSDTAGTTETFAASIDWGDGTPLQTDVDIEVENGGPGRPTTGTISALHTYSDAGTYAVQVTVADDDGLMTTSTAQIIVRDPHGENCLPTINFDIGGDGIPLPSGTRIRDQFATLGITVSSGDPEKPAMIFDSAFPTGGDYDLGTPNKKFGGPGIGSGGKRTNRVAQGNVLIISEDNDGSDPDDNARGGVLRFDFDHPVSIDSLGLLDVQSGRNRIDLYDGFGVLLSTVDLPNSANNEYARVTLDTSGVARMDVHFAGSGAITDLQFCRDYSPIPDVATRFFVTDSKDDLVYRYDAAGDAVGQFRTSRVANPRGATTVDVGNPLWIVSEEGSDERVYVYDTEQQTLLGSWTARGLTSPEGIGTDGNDIWIVDDGTDRVQRYEGAAARVRGRQHQSDRFSLVYGNDSPTGLTTDGQTIWVVDDVADRVYVYDVSGNSINWWDLDPRNSDPSGVTIRPDGGSGIWVVDAADRAVYHYAEKMLGHQGGQSAIGRYPLASSNSHPTGIADPVMSISFGETVTDGVSVAGEVDQWTFDLATPSDVFVNFVSVSGGALAVSLTAPDGTTLLSRNSSFQAGLDSGRIELDQVGTYVINVTSSSTPDYAFELIEVVDDPTRRIELGERISDAFDPRGQVDRYVFSADAGTQIFLDRIGLGATARLQLTTPSGTNLFSPFSSFFNDRGPVTLNETGDYALTLAYQSGDTLGYEFQLNDVTDTNRMAIETNTSVEATLDVAGRQLDFEFSTASAVDVVLDVTQLPGGGSDWSITNASGEIVFSDFLIRDSNKFTLGPADTYTLSIRSSGATGDIGFVVWDSTDLGPIGVGTETTVSQFVRPLQSVRYELDLVAGQEFVFDVQQNVSSNLGIGYASAFTLTTPGGTDVFHRVTSDQSRLVAPESGTYTLVAEPFNRGYRDATGDFTWRLQTQIYPAESSIVDTKGGEFFLAAPAGFFAALTPKLVLSSPVDTQVMIDLPGLGWLHAFDLEAGTSTIIELPQEILLERLAGEAIEFKGIHVIADAEVSAYLMQDGFTSGDAATGIPLDAVGTEYLVESYPASCALGCQASQLSIVATQDDTVVTITPSIDVGSSENRRLAGDPFDVFLDAGQTYKLQGGGFVAGPGFTPNGLSGTEVVSNFPVAVYGGNPETYVPDVGAADILFQQLLPVAAWGTRYASVPLAGRSGGDTFRVLASADDTVVSIDGVVVATLDRGDHYETILDQPAEFTADAPVMVTRFGHGGTFDHPDAAEDPAVTTGDPLMLTLVPTEQFGADYVVESAGEGINDHYLTIVTMADGIDDVILDGTPLAASEFMPIGDGTFVGASIAVASGTHSVSSVRPLSVEVYGFGNYDSYGYFAGSRISPVGRLGSLSLSPASATRLPGSIHTATAIVVDGDGHPLKDVRIDFDVRGTTDTRGYGYSDTDGTVTFSYTSQDVGVDDITARVGQRQVASQVRWIGAAPTVQVLSHADGDQVVSGDTFLLSGRALPGPSGGQIIAVALNGRRVDSMDAAGNFFVEVLSHNGDNSLEVVATDEFGQEAAVLLSVRGQPETLVDTDNLVDATLAAELSFAGTTFNRAANTLSTRARLTATSDTALPRDSYVQFAAIDPLRVVPVTSDEDPKPADGSLGLTVSFVDQIPAGGIRNGEFSSPRSVAFANPLRERFSFEYRVLNSINRGPEITSAPITRAAVGDAYDYLIQASDRDGDALHVSIASGPESATLNDQGHLRWAPTDQDLGHHPVVVEVSDGRGGVSRQSFVLHVVDTLPNRPPVFLNSPLTMIDSGGDYTSSIAASDPDGDAVVFQLDTAPDGMIVDPATGVISWAGPADGNYPVVLRVTDTAGASSTLTFNLAVGAVGPPNRAPNLFAQLAPEAFVDQLYLEFLVASDADGDPLTFELLAAPEGMSLETLSGSGSDARARIRYTPDSDDVGSQDVLIAVSDGNGGFATRSYSINVAAQREPVPPIIHSEPMDIASVGQRFAYSVLATDPDGDVEDLVYGKVSGPDGLLIDPNTGEVEFTPGVSDLGEATVTIEVVDVDGLKATQSWTLSIRPDNSAPLFESDPETSVSAGAAYRYDAFARDEVDAVRYSLVANPAGMTISQNSGFVFWRPDPSDLGDHAITIRATDERGLSSDQDFVLSVTSDQTAPIAEVSVSDSPILPGETTRLLVRATDDVAIQSLTLSIDGVEVPIDSQSGFTFAAHSPGIPQVVLIATDTSGNVTTATLDPALRVLDPGDTVPPLIELNGPLPGEQVTYLTDVVGTITDPNLEFYELQVSLSRANQFTTVATRLFQPGPGGSGVVDDLLGVFDPTLLPNDLYDLRLVAQDVSGNRSTLVTTVSVLGGAKLGNYRLELTDLAVPLAGIPIEINRVYDTLDASFVGDFGYGWKLDVGSPRIRESVPVSESERLGAGIFGARAFRTGTRVYMTTPGGRRVGFTFDPVPEPQLLGTRWRPRFVADPGVLERLEVDDVPLEQNADGTFGLYLLGFAYNPDSYTLVTRDQLRYTYDQFADRQLQSIADRNNVTLTFDDNGIHSSVGPAIIWTRDDQGRISEIVDTRGGTFSYQYDSAGDLVAFQNPSDDRTELFYHPNQSHYLESRVNPRGVAIQTLQYDSNGRMVGVVDAAGNRTDNEYDVESQFFSTTDPLGNQISVTHDQMGNITRVVDPKGNTTEISYDDPRHPMLETQIVDARGTVTTMIYDNLGNAIRIEEPDRYTEFSYNDRNDVIGVTGPVPMRGEIGEIPGVAFTYDENGNLASYTSAAGETEFFVNDALGRPIEVHNALGKVTRFEFSSFKDPDRIIFTDGSERIAIRDAGGLISETIDENGSEVEYFYDAFGRPLGSSDALGHRSRIVYDKGLAVRSIDPLGRETLFEYDDRSLLSKIIDPAGGETHRSYDELGRLIEQTNQAGQTERWTYTAIGEVATHTDTAGFTTRSTYDENSNLVERVDARGHASRFVYDNRNRLTEFINPLGQSTEYQYDVRGNVVSITNPSGATTTFVYDAIGRLVQKVDPLGGVQRWEFDDVGNLVVAVDERGYQTRWQYDDRNRLVAEIDPLGFIRKWDYDPTGRLVEFIDAEGNATEVRYDAAGQVSMVLDAIGGATTYQYDSVGNMIASTDEIGRSTRWAYDVLDRVITEFAADDQATQFEYDSVGNLIALSDPSNNRTQWRIGVRNEVVERIDPLGGSTHFEYDELGYLIRTTDRLDRTTELTRNPLGWVTDETWYNAADEAILTYEFDYDAIGNLVLATGPDSRSARGYDANGRLVEASESGSHPNQPSVHWDYFYDLSGNLNRIVDSDGIIVDIEVDSRNLIESMTWHGSGIAGSRLDYSRDGRGLVVGVNRYADLAATVSVAITEVSYDAVGRPQSIDHLDRFGSAISTHSLAFDAADQLVAWTIDGQEMSYTYDVLGQVSSNSSNSIVREQFAYDPLGNRISAETEIGPNSRLESDSRFDYEYDAEGNLVLRIERATGSYRTYEYDHRNRLTGSSEFSGAQILISRSEFVYDAFDRLIARYVDVDGAGDLDFDVTWTVYEGVNAWADFDHHGDVAARYLFGAGADHLIARWRPGEGTAWYLTDHLGSVQVIIDNDGVALNEIRYDSFGSIIEESNPDDADRYKFTGREWDAELGYYYYRARFYDASTGRFLSEDPTGFAGADINLYRYVGNAPLTNTDPSGLVSAPFYSKAIVVGTHTASAVGGFTLGYVCGRLDAAASGASDAEAHQAGLFGGVIGTAIGFGVAGVISGIGGLAPTAVTYLGGLFLSVGVTIGLVEIASSPNISSLVIRTTCFVADVALGTGAGKLGRKLANSGDSCAPNTGAVSPQSFPTPYSQLSGARVKALNAKVADRTITQAEYKLLQWHKRFAARRKAGVDRFWDQEAARLRAGLPGTRNWTPEQVESIVAGGRAQVNGRTLVGHHTYSASCYPHLADQGEYIYPVTFGEHFHRWHGGNWRTSAPGRPLNPDIPEDF